MKIWRVLRQVFRYDNLMSDTEEFYSTYEKASTAYNELIKKEEDWFHNGYIEHNECTYYTNRSIENQFYISFDDNSATIMLFIEEINVL